MHNVYINRVAKFLPNKVVSNDEMEQFLGFINDTPSKSKRIVLRNNKILKRYYAMDKNGSPTHSNAELVALAIKNLFKNNPEEIKEIDLLSCGTSSPDQMMPSHAVMVHGHLPEMNSIEVVSPSGVCCSGMHAFKYAYLSLKTGEKNKAIATGSERLSASLHSSKYKDEVQKLVELNENPYIAFEKDFLRWMLSDGAGALLMENKPNENGISLKVEWIEGVSYANIEETCMWMACEKQKDGSLKSYLDFSQEEIMENSTLSIRQDTKLLGKQIVSLGFDKLADIFKKRGHNVDEVDYFLPHLSSFFFESKIADKLIENGMGIPKEKWFTNLATKGNVGAGSIYLMIEELFNEKDLKKGQKILLAVPESSRFSYVFSLLTVC